MDLTSAQFGRGFNACPVRNVATLELNKMTATLIRDFDIRLQDLKGEWKYHVLFVTSQSGWPVYVKSRGGGEGEKEGVNEPWVCLFDASCCDCCWWYIFLPSIRYVALAFGCSFARVNGAGFGVRGRFVPR